jgi:hypothetical protein
MTQYNPTTLKWTAPTKKVDGTDIEPGRGLAYTLLVDAVETLDFPGSLNPDGTYSAPLDQMLFTESQLYSITLKAFFTDAPTDKSAPSGALDIMFVSAVVPEAPLDFSAA